MGRGCDEAAGAAAEGMAPAIDSAAVCGGWCCVPPSHTGVGGRGGGACGGSMQAAPHPTPAPLLRLRPAPFSSLSCNVPAVAMSRPRVLVAGWHLQPTEAAPSLCGLGCSVAVPEAQYGPEWGGMWAGGGPYLRHRWRRSWGASGALCPQVQQPEAHVWAPDACCRG